MHFSLLTISSTNPSYFCELDCVGLRVKKNQIDYGLPLCSMFIGWMLPFISRVFHHTEKLRRNARIVKIFVSKIRKLPIPFSFLAGSIYYADAP